MNQHTKGPWKVWLSTKTLELTVHTLPSDTKVADITYITREQTKANAKLIAAAPELLEALEDAAEWVSTGKVDGVSFDEIQVIEVLRETIAKAKGETNE